MNFNYYFIMCYSECYSCGPCGGKCDKCSLDVCINNMENHRKIYRLKDDFCNKIYLALENLYDKCVKIQNNLNYNYGIYIELTNIYDKIIQSNDFLSKMRIKKEEIQNCINSIKNEIEITKKEKRDKINQINNDHEQKIYDTNEKFEKEKKKYEMKDPEYEEKIKSKKQKLDDLTNLKDNIKIDIDGIVQSFINEKRIEEEKKLNINKSEIDNKYAFVKKEFKYTENENEFKNQCLNEINKIKLYSSKIPNYENFIKLSKLDKYFNQI